MSEREFEAWLSLLGGLLKLSPRQRQDISEELRTHLEERLDDLIASGLSRDDAIAAALDEFGDAAGLAQHFTHIAHLRKRRRLMRWTYGTIAATTCAILTLAAFWPNNQPNGPLTPGKVAAQDEAAPGGGFASGGFGAEGAPETKGAADPFAGSRERIEARLSQPYEKSSFLGVPLKDVLNDLSTELDLDILIDSDVKGIIEIESTVDFYVKPGRMSARTVLQTILKQTCGDEIGYVIRDEVMFITKKASATEIQTYNVCDLVASNAALSPVHSGDYGTATPDAGYGAPGSLGAVPDRYPGTASSSAYSRAVAPRTDSAYPGSAYGAQKPARRTSGSRSGIALVEVIEHTVQPGTWVTAPEDDAPTIEYFNGLLIVKHTQETHRQIKQLLEQMRASLSERPPRQNTHLPRTSDFLEYMDKNLSYPGAVEDVPQVAPAK